jgi:hypothetical protein
MSLTTEQKNVETVYSKLPVEAQGFYDKMGLVWANKQNAKNLAAKAKLILPTVREKRQKLAKEKSEITNALWESGVAPNVAETQAIQKQLDTLAHKISEAEEKAGVDSGERRKFTKTADYLERDAQKLYVEHTGHAIPEVTEVDPTILAKIETEAKARAAAKKLEKAKQK